MGRFSNFFKKNQKQENVENTESPKFPEPVANDMFKTVPVDEIYMVSIPTDWQIYESDRFRTVNKDETIHFSISNYANDKVSSPLDKKALEEQILPLFENFVKEGGYIAHDDLEITNDYAYQAFNVDDETQYYYYTSRIIKQKTLVVIAFILKEKGDYQTTTSQLIKKIGSQIYHKVADL
ncbi:MAG: hypothetical protein WDZ35_13690 [Crocinitomicaceae bacterium]